MPSFNKNTLFKKAVEHYNDFHFERGSSITDEIENLDKEFLNRISINMLRHEFTIYENELFELYKDKGYIRLKNKINTAIYEKYPFLF